MMTTLLPTAELVPGMIHKPTETLLTRNRIDQLQEKAPNGAVEIIIAGAGFMPGLKMMIVGQ